MATNWISNRTSLEKTRLGDPNVAKTFLIWNGLKSWSDLLIFRHPNPKTPEKQLELIRYVVIRLMCISLVISVRWISHQSLLSRKERLGEWTYRGKYIIIAVSITAHSMPFTEVRLSSHCTECSTPQTPINELSQCTWRDFGRLCFESVQHVWGGERYPGQVQMGGTLCWPPVRDGIPPC